jgi:hypothetical protein
MIATDRMVFLHLHKSGGSFVNALLRECVPGARFIGYHYPYREIPQADRHLPVVGTVRSPWSYYVSWFHFQAGLPTQNALFQIVSDDGSLGFGATIANLVNLAADNPRLQRLEARLPETYGPRGINLLRRDVDDLRASGEGFYSFLYRRLYAGTVGATIVRTERLRDELRPVLERVGYLPNECIGRFLSDAPPRNVSRHGATASYFDAELAGLVAERDRFVVERHGYAVPLIQS